MQVPVAGSLVLAQLRHSPARWLLPALGVALAVVLVVLSAATAEVSAARAVAYGLEGLPAGDRSLVVSINALVTKQDELDRLDAAVRQEIPSLAAVQPTRQLLYRQLADGRGSSFFLGAVDRLPATVALDSGRLPQVCRPTHCEVVRLATGGTVPPAPSQGGSLGIDVVGVVHRTDPLVLSGTFGTDPGVPLYVAGDVAAATRLARLAVFQRSLGWVAPLDLDRVQRDGVDGYLDAIAHAADQLNRTDAGLILTSPDEVLADVRDRSTASTRRFTALGAAASALLLGFVVVAGLARRRDALALRELLDRRGAAPTTIVATAGLLGVGVVALGLVTGLSIGAVAAAAAATRAGLDAATLTAVALRESAPGVIVLAVLAVAVLAAVLLWPPTAARSAWRVAGGLALAGLAAVALAASRGTAGAADLDARGDLLVPALPLVGALVSGVVAARLWPPTVRWAERLAPRGAIAVRLGLLGGASHPAAYVVTAGFLAACLMAATFATAYAATLASGAQDEAAFAVPLDVRLTPGPSGAQPAAVAGGRVVATADGDAQSFPVVRTSGAVSTGGVGADPVALLGVDPRALPLVRRWDRTVGGGAPDDLARALQVPLGDVGPVVPASSRRVVLPYHGDAAELEVTAWFRDPSGLEPAVQLTERGPGTLAATLPELGPGSRLAALTVRETPQWATRHQHALSGSRDVPSLDVQLRLGVPEFRTAAATRAPTSWDWAAWSATGTHAVAGRSQITLDLRLKGQEVALLPPSPLPSAVAAGGLPVLADPETAALASGATLAVRIGPDQTLPARVVGVLDRFPTLGSRFVVADVAALQVLLSRADPGSGAVRELWVASPDGGAALSSAVGGPPYDRLTVQRRDALADRLAADPVAQGSAAVLAQAGWVGAAVAAVALLLLVVADRREGASEAYAWESDGVQPATLRAALVVRAVSAALVAVPVGLLGGLALATASSALLAVSATGAEPQPPLQVAASAATALLLVAAAVVLAFAVAGSAASRAYRGPDARTVGLDQ